MPLTPEQQARVEIDGQLTEAGWVVQDYGAINIHAADGVAVREFPLKWTEDGQPKGGFVDYLLYAHGQVIGVVEAKPEGHTLQGVVVQSEKYTHGLPEQVPARMQQCPSSILATSGSPMAAAGRISK